MWLTCKLIIDAKWDLILQLTLMFCFPFSVIFGNTFLVNVKFRIRFFMGNRKPQTANCSLPLRVWSFTLPRFQILARCSVQFSPFLLAKIWYKTRVHIGIVSWRGSPEETRRLMKPGLPSHKEISKIKWNSWSNMLKIGTKQRLSQVMNSVTR